jgi:hypothetical protein
MRKEHKNVSTFIIISVQSVARLVAHTCEYSSAYMSTQVAMSLEHFEDLHIFYHLDFDTIYKIRNTEFFRKYPEP